MWGESYPYLPDPINITIIKLKINFILKLHRFQSASVWYDPPLRITSSVFCAAAAHANPRARVIYHIAKSTRKTPARYGRGAMQFSRRRRLASCLGVLKNVRALDGAMP